MSPKLHLIFALALAGGLAFPAAGATTAPSGYTVQPILQAGGKAGDIPIPRGSVLFAAPLNDSGQLYIDAGTLDGSHPDTLLQYSAGSFTPLEVAGRSGPAGTWPMDTFAFGPSPQTMNQQGDVVFAVASQSANPLGTFLWNAAAKTVTPIALKGTPAGGDFTFTVGAGVTPAINNHDEIALLGTVTDSSGTAGWALFFRTRGRHAAAGAASRPEPAGRCPARRTDRSGDR